MALQLSLTKPGQSVQKLQLNLTKGAIFSVELFWDSKHDLDAHALLATNDGNGAKVCDLNHILSCFNVKDAANQGRALSLNPNKSFGTPEGALLHSGDSRTGDVKDVDEVITIDSGKVPVGVNEIPVFVTIYPSQPAKFSAVARAGIRIKDAAGKVLGEYELTKEFGAFSAVQMGSLVLNGGGWEYMPVGVGFDGDFNTVLQSFS